MCIYYMTLFPSMYIHRCMHICELYIYRYTCMHIWKYSQIHTFNTGKQTKQTYMQRNIHAYIFFLQLSDAHTQWHIHTCIPTNIHTYMHACMHRHLHYTYILKEVQSLSYIPRGMHTYIPICLHTCLHIH